MTALLALLSYYAYCAYLTQLEIILILQAGCLQRRQYAVIPGDYAYSFIVFCGTLVQVNLIHIQGWFSVCAQPMRDGVTM